MSDVVLSCSGVDKSFIDGDRTVKVLHQIDLTLKQGERLAIMGASGSGKSTLLHVLGGLDEPTAGEIWLDGQNLFQLKESAKCALRNAALGFVYQFHHLLSEFSALENVSMPLLIRGVGVNQAREQAAEMLKRVGLDHRLTHRPGELSGGERQRTAMARALVTSPKCVLADEPTGNLDNRTAGQLDELMLDLNEELGISFLLVTHDVSLAQKMNRVLYLEDGRLSETQP